MKEVEGFVLLERRMSLLQELPNVYIVAVLPLLSGIAYNRSRPRGYKTFFMVNSTEHEIFPAYKC